MSYLGVAYHRGEAVFFAGDHSSSNAENEMVGEMTGEEGRVAKVANVVSKVIET